MIDQAGEVIVVFLQEVHAQLDLLFFLYDCFIDLSRRAGSSLLLVTILILIFHHRKLVGIQQDHFLLSIVFDFLFKLEQEGARHGDVLENVGHLSCRRLMLK